MVVPMIARKSIILLCVTVLFMGPAHALFDDFQKYNAMTDAIFIGNYTSTATNAVIDSNADDTVYIKITGSAASVQLVPKFYIINKPFSADMKILSGTTGEGNLYSMIYAIGFMLNGTPENSGTGGGYAASLLIVNNTIAGPNLTFALRRCPIISGQYHSCGTLLTKTNITASNDVIYYAAGKPVFNNSVSFNVTEDNNGNIKIYFNRTEILSYNDQIYSQGNISFYVYSLGVPYLAKIDNLSISGSALSASNYSLASYPEFNKTKQINFVRSDTNMITSWEALNMYVYPQFTIETPAGYVNDNTQVTCPVFDLTQTQATWGCCYVKHKLFVFYKPSTNYCTMKVQKDNYDQYIYTYWWLPGISKIAIENYTATKIINIDTTGWYPTTVAILNDSSGKYAFSGGSISCSQPTNLSIAVEFTDINACDGGGLKDLFFTTARQIGIYPGSSTPCDYQINNGTCFNGTTAATGIGAGEAGIATAIVSQATAPNSGLPAMDMANLFLQPWVIAFCLVIGMGILASQAGGAIMGVAGLLGGFLIMIILGILPVWLAIVILIPVAFIAAKTVQGLFSPSAGGI
jgi:hypothetical protein